MIDLRTHRTEHEGNLDIRAAIIIHFSGRFLAHVVILMDIILCAEVHQQ
jgi:hypothetical protein